jgi:hypothetical protein
LRAPWLLLLLSGCAPAVQSSGHLLLVAGGLVEGRVAQLQQQTFLLPSAPLLAAAHSGILYAAYPYQLLVYTPGSPVQSLPLPGIPRFLHARPQPLVGLKGGLYRPGVGLLPYSARDGRATPLGIFWVSAKGFFLNQDQLASGDFRWVVAEGSEAIALSDHEAVVYPSGLHFPLPTSPRAVALSQNLYLLGAQGLFALSPTGLEEAFYPGSFQGMTADHQGVYLLKDRQLIILSPQLEAP